MIIRFSETIAMPNHCGEIREITTHEHAPQGNVAHVIVKVTSKPHCHRIITETYWIIRGRGRIVLDDQEHEIGPNTTILITPHQVHYVIPRTEIEMLVFATPAWRSDDVYFVG